MRRAWETTRPLLTSPPIGMEQFSYGLAITPLVFSVPAYDCLSTTSQPSRTLPTRQPQRSRKTKRFPSVFFAFHHSSHMRRKTRSQDTPEDEGFARAGRVIGEFTRSPSTMRGASTMLIDQRTALVLNLFSCRSERATMMRSCSDTAAQGK